MRVLIVTVGGSDAPIVNCIKNYRPDRVVFLCTEDENGNKGRLEPLFLENMHLKT